MLRRKNLAAVIIIGLAMLQLGESLEPGFISGPVHLGVLWLIAFLFLLWAAAPEQPTTSTTEGRSQS